MRFAAAHSSKFGNRSYSESGCQLIAAAAGNHLLLNCDRFGRLDRGHFTSLPNPDPAVFLAVAW